MMLWVAFLAQVVLVAGAVWGARVVARGSKGVWTWACVAATVGVLVGPLLRVFPTLPIRVLGAAAVSCVELTWLFVPGMFVLVVGAVHAPRRGDRRAIGVLVAVCGVFFVRSGWWMVAPELADLGPTKMEGAVCRQTTGYTCVAASMVTLLRARGIEASETEMARLAYIEKNGGATDSRAVWALERKLAGTGLKVEYAKMGLAELMAAPKPCLVQLDWGFFVSHMVPVMKADEREVVIGDPLEGTRRMETEEFVRQWKGMGVWVR